MRGAKVIVGALFCGVAMMSAVAAPKLVLHLDFNTAQFRREVVVGMLQEAARDGYDAVLWEIENKVKLDSLPGIAVEEAFTKDEFRGLLQEAERLGLEPIPLLQTFGHAEYVLSKPAYTNLREQADRYDCYCVSKPEVAELQKRVVAEYLDLFGPKVKWFHLGGDEALVFATCPVCKARKPMELYSEHLDAVASVLRAKGVRPGIWCDMVMGDKYVADLAKVPRDFIIWHWDYQVGAKNTWTLPWTKQLPKARDLGFDVVFSGSSSSYGDSPYLPEMRLHRDNLAYGADLVLRERLAGLCVTSWSIRQNLKLLQQPLVRFAARRLRRPGASAAADWEETLPTCGVTMAPADFDDFTAWAAEICKYDGRGWHWFKDAVPPPAGELDRVLAKHGKPDAVTVSNLLAGVRRTLPQATGVWREAGELQLQQLESYAAIARGETPFSPPREKAVRHYGREQTPASARNSAAIVLGLLVDRDKN